MQIFNYHYINITERTCGFKSEKVEFDIGSDNKNGVLCSISDKYKNYPSIVEIHKMEMEIKTILKSMNYKKTLGIDKTPTKLVKLASDILAETLSIAITTVPAPLPFLIMVK